MNPYKPILQVFQDAGLNDRVKRERRKPGEIYADVLVVKCSYDNWWYKELIGMSFFCRLSVHYYRFPDGTFMEVISDAYPTRLTNTIKEESLMSFHSSDIIIL